MAQDRTENSQKNDDGIDLIIPLMDLKFHGDSAITSYISNVEDDVYRAANNMYLMLCYEKNEGVNDISSGMVLRTNLTYRDDRVLQKIRSYIVDSDKHDFDDPNKIGFYFQKIGVEGDERLNRLEMEKALLDFRFKSQGSTSLFTN